jgi:hypothetical protein
VACGITTVLLLLLCVIPGTVVAQTSAEPQSTSAPPPHAAIRVEEVATQATEVAKLLRTWSAQGAPSPAIDTIHQVLPEVSGTIDLKLAATSTLLQGHPTLEALQTQEQFWQRRHLQTTGWLHALTERAPHLQEVGQRLAALHTTWTATRTAAQQTQAPEPILQQIDATLAALAEAQTPLEAQRTAVLDLQSRVAHEVARCEDVRTQITQVQQAVTGMLGRDGLPLWRADFWTGVRTALPERVRQVGAAPDQVITLLERVARAHPQVLPEPPPRAFFIGYSDRAINFTLFTWPDHFNHWGQVKGDLTAAVYEAVSAAGLSFPFPQREVRVLHEAEAGSPGVPVNADQNSARADP